MAHLSRRSFTKQALGSVLTYSLLETAFCQDLFGGRVKPILWKWLADVNELSLAVKNQEIPQVHWQTKIEALFSKVELPELLRGLDFDKLTKNVNSADRGVRGSQLKFRNLDLLPGNLVFGTQIVALKKHCSIVPHGHNNMATAFLVLEGELRGRHYDRLEDEQEHLIIRPTIDGSFHPGDCSTVSDYKDNVHWFQAVSRPAIVLSIHVPSISPGSGLPTGRVYLDPNGERLRGGLIRARRIGYAEAKKLFG